MSQENVEIVRRAWKVYVDHGGIDDADLDDYFAEDCVVEDFPLRLRAKPSKPSAFRSRRCRRNDPRDRCGGAGGRQDGLIARLDEYTDRREALEAAGL
jgi:ketosteroid isomerase-like protein